MTALMSLIGINKHPIPLTVAFVAVSGMRVQIVTVLAFTIHSIILSEPIVSNRKRIFHPQHPQKALLHTYSNAKEVFAVYARFEISFRTHGVFRFLFQRWYSFFRGIIPSLLLG